MTSEKKVPATEALMLHDVALSPMLQESSHKMLVQKTSHSHRRPAKFVSVVFLQLARSSG